MVGKSAVVVFSFVITYAYATSLCTKGLKLRDLPFTIAEQLLDLLMNGINAVGVGCNYNSTIPTDSVKFWYFNRYNSYVLLDPDNPRQVNASKPTIFVLHGWLCNITDAGIPDLIDAYLKRYDCNIIGLDWSDLSAALFTTAYCNSPLIGKKVAELIHKMNATLGVSVDKIHMVGFSLGGQIAGYAGHIMKNKYNATIGRITGLDPGGGYFQFVPPSNRLDPSDAKLVDVIHTNQGQLGYFGGCGTVDFFVNSGVIQPGCVNITRNTGIYDILDLSVMSVLCSHIRAVTLMTESINSSKFHAKSCWLCPYLPVPDLFYSTSAVMGEDCMVNVTNPKYILYTNNASPYAIE